MKLIPLIVLLISLVFFIRLLIRKHIDQTDDGQYVDESFLPNYYVPTPQKQKTAVV